VKEKKIQMNGLNLEIDLSGTTQGFYILIIIINNENIVESFVKE